MYTYICTYVCIMHTVICMYVSICKYIFIYKYVVHIWKFFLGLLYQPEKDVQAGAKTETTETQWHRIGYARDGEYQLLTKPPILGRLKSPVTKISPLPSPPSYVRMKRGWGWGWGVAESSPLQLTKIFFFGLRNDGAKMKWNDKLRSKWIDYTV